MYFARQYLRKEIYKLKLLPTFILDLLFLCLNEIYEIERVIIKEILFLTSPLNATVLIAFKFCNLLLLPVRKPIQS